MSINNIISGSKGKWSDQISDADYALLKANAETIDEDAISEAHIETQIHNLPIPEPTPKAKTKWLKKMVCQVLNDPSTEEELKKVPLDKAKEKLLGIVVTAVLNAIPALGPVINIIINILVFLIKRALKKGIDNWCD